MPGPRFLIPLLPFLCFALAPVLRRVPATVGALAARLGRSDARRHERRAAALEQRHAPLDRAHRRRQLRRDGRSASSGVGHGWIAIPPFYAFAVIAAGAAVAATRLPVVRRDVALAVAALAAWIAVEHGAPALLRGRPARPPELRASLRRSRSSSRPRLGDLSPRPRRTPSERRPAVLASRLRGPALRRAHEMGAAGGAARPRRARARAPARRPGAAAGHSCLNRHRDRALPEVPPADLRRGRRAGGGRPDAAERDHRRTGAPGLSLRRPARHRQDLDGAHPRQGPELRAGPDGRRRTAPATPASRSPPAPRST